MDEIGDTEEQMSKFRGFISNLPLDSHIRKTGLILHRRDIAEVRSHDHILMQCLDVVLGSVSFRLNRKHIAVPEGQKDRGKRTIAKHELQMFIQKRICEVTGKKNFALSGSTFSSELDAAWYGPYRHWKFVPAAHTKAKN